MRDEFRITKSDNYRIFAVLSGFGLRDSFGSRISSFGFFIMNAVNENLIRDVVAEVMERLNGSSAPVKAAPAPATPPPSSPS